MFELRVKILLVVLLFAVAVLAARLVDMQIVHAETYRRQAEDALLLPVKVLPAVRGRILDRLGVELVADEPCWDVQVDYGILAMAPDHLAARAQRYRRQHRYGEHLSLREVETALRQEIETMWADLVRFSGRSRAELDAEAQTIRDRVRAVREEVAARRGFEADVREERMPHAILPGLDDQAQVAAREILGKYPWVTIEDSTRRGVHAGPALAHVLGRLGPVSKEDRQEDPFADEPLRSYEAFDRKGLAGVERAAERFLRGSRGRFQATRDGEIIEDIPPQPGCDVHLTLRRDLQDRLFALFERHSRKLPDQPGGAIVVLDVANRECLAMVSYPSYDPQRFAVDYDELRTDMRHQPLLFRAVMNRYAPGSIVKPLACLAALGGGVIDLGTQVTCTGALFPENPTAWRCWADQNGTRMQHGPVDVVGAIKHSCNIFLYRAGEQAGVQQLTTYFQMAGFGEVPGTGLPEEVEGINPTPAWLAENKGENPTAGLARMFAIGQSYVSVTVVQAANLMALYASGERRPVTLIRELAQDVAWSLGGNPAHWQAIRQGMYAVVNDYDGTAHKYAYLSPDRGYVLCGKTGSAQANPWPISYSIVYAEEDGQERVAIVPAGSRDEALAMFLREHGETAAFEHQDIQVHERWPSRQLEPGRTYSHAWFVGYLQPADGSGAPLWERRAPVAFAVLVEFGGSGGRASGPLGHDVAETLLDVLGPTLDPDAPAMVDTVSAGAPSGNPGRVPGR